MMARATKNSAQIEEQFFLFSFTGLSSSNIYNGTPVTAKGDEVFFSLKNGSLTLEHSLLNTVVEIVRM